MNGAVICRLLPDIPGGGGLFCRCGRFFEDVFRKENAGKEENVL